MECRLALRSPFPLLPTPLFASLRPSRLCVECFPASAPRGPPLLNAKTPSREDAKKIAALGLLLPPSMPSTMKPSAGSCATCGLRLSSLMVLPSPYKDKVGTSTWRFPSSRAGLRFPLSILHPRRYRRRRMTRGQDGSLILSCTAFSSAALYRFVTGAFTYPLSLPKARETDSGCPVSHDGGLPVASAGP